MAVADQTNVPKLRFPEFDGGWDKSRLGEIASFSKGKGISKADIVPGGITPCIRYGELYTHYGTSIGEIVSATNVANRELVLSEGGEVIVPASGEDAKDIATAAVVLEKGVALGGDLNVVHSNMDGLFLASYLSGKKRMTLAALAQGNSVVHLYPTQLGSLELHVPSLPEQKKIAAFLGAMDEKLTALCKKRDLLVTYKRGAMQQIFSQDIRFTRDDGTTFSDWQEKRMGDVFTRVTRKNSENNLNVLTISAQQGLVSQQDYFNKSVSAQDVTAYYLLRKGDFAYNKSYSKGYPMGAIKRLNDYETGVVSTLYICFSAADERAAMFFEQYFDSGGLNRELHKIAQEGARNHGLLNLSVVEFFRDIVLPFPHPDEQQKITEFLSAVDAKIDAVAAQITQMKAFKKGLLQQMFV